MSSATTLKFVQQDFEVFYLSGVQSLHQQNPYLQLGKDITRNPPPAMLLFSILLVLPIEESQVLWFIFSFAAFILGSFFLFKTIDAVDGKLSLSTNFIVWIVYMIFVLMFFPFRYNIGSGQVNNFLFLLITAGLFYAQKRRDSLTPVFFALAILLKITPIIFLFNLLAAKKFKQLIFLLLSLFGFSALAGLIFGFGIYKDYLAIPGSFFDFKLSVYYNQSIVGLLSRIFKDPQTTKMLYLLCVTFAIALWVYVRYRYRFPRPKGRGSLILAQNLLHSRLESRGFFAQNKKVKPGGDLIFWSISIIYIPLFSPFAWQYHFVIILIPLVISAYLGYKLRLHSIFFVCLAVSYYFTGWNVGNSEAYINKGLVGSIILSNTFIGTFFLLLLNLVIVKKLSKA